MFLLLLFCQITRPSTVAKVVVCAVSQLQTLVAHPEFVVH